MASLALRNFCLEFCGMRRIRKSNDKQKKSNKKEQCTKSNCPQNYQDPMSGNVLFGTRLKDFRVPFLIRVFDIKCYLLTKTIDKSGALHYVRNLSWPTLGTRHTT